MLIDIELKRVEKKTAACKSQADFFAATAAALFTHLLQQFIQSINDGSIHRAKVKLTKFSTKWNFYKCSQPDTNGFFSAYLDKNGNAYAGILIKWTSFVGPPGERQTKIDWIEMCALFMARTANACFCVDKLIDLKWNLDGAIGSVQHWETASFKIWILETTVVEIRRTLTW